MFAVIFRATLSKVDDEYYALAQTLRTLAKEFGCYDFVSTCERGEEIAISYWENLEQIQHWKNNELHRQAQKSAHKYYKSYSVQITKIEREYHNP